MKPGKKCPECGEYKLAPEFGTRRAGGVTYLRAYCKPCQASRLRARRATPEGIEATRRDNTKRRSCPETYRRQLESWRNKYHSNHEFREGQLQKSRETLASNSSRVRRINRALDHFSGRDGWLAALADAILCSPNAQGLQYLSPRIDYLCADYCNM